MGIVGGNDFKDYEGCIPNMQIESNYNISKEKDSNEVVVHNKYKKGKTEWDLLDFEFLQEFNRGMEFGAYLKKPKAYGKNSWRKGVLLLDVINAIIRHTVALLFGKKIAEDSKVHHAAHIACNAMMFWWIEKYKPEFDNRYYKDGKYKEIKNG